MALLCENIYNPGLRVNKAQKMDEDLAMCGEFINTHQIAYTFFIY